MPDQSVPDQSVPATPAAHDVQTHAAGRLKRSVGFWGLMFISLGSIIGSGWLMGALNAAKVAGPASILSWLLAAGLLALLALVYAELGATYPVAGGGARFPYYSHGPIVGFTAGWAAWLQAVFIAPIQVIAVISYVNSVAWVNANFNMITAAGENAGLLNANGLIVAVLLMVVFTAVNLAGAKFFADSNAILVIFKSIVPLLTIAVIGSLQFNADNFQAGGGFMPFGFPGVFAALTGGIVFALQGFEQAAQLAGEARDPRRDLSRAILMAMLIAAVLYSLLQLVMIGALDPANIASGWSRPLGTDPSNYGAWYTLALALGAAWLARLLLAASVVSPAGSGIVYMGATARLSYALGEEAEMPQALASTNRDGVPVVSILVAAAVGTLALGPFKDWATLVNVATGATAIMYAFAPIALGSLHRSDGRRRRSYRTPLPVLVLPAAFCSANLIIYWGGFAATWKLALGMMAGLILFAIGAVRAGTDARKFVRYAIWMAPWFVGQVALGWLGRYGDGATSTLPEWVDIGAVIVFSLAIYYWAVSQRMEPAATAAAIGKDAAQIDYD